MGKNNRQRRASKKRQRHRRPGGVPPRGEPGAASGGGPGDPPPPEDLLRAAAWTWASEPARFEAAVEALSRQGRPALAALDELLEAAVGDLWRRGWTPADLVHVTSRRLSDAHGRVAAEAVIADGRGRERRGQTVHPRWEAQLAALQDRVADPALQLDGERLRLGVGVLALVWRLAKVARTVPPPGAAPATPYRATGLDERVLGRVRALLSKAESTEFDEEAEALTGKAQELIARHAIDEALLHAADDDDVGEPSLRRILLDDPYIEAKRFLLGRIAGANRCRTVYSPDCGWVTVFGYEHDLDAVELLGASLLAQATHAMTRQGPRRDAHGRSRTRSFRRSFLFGFAQRIGERLREATEQQVAEKAPAERGRLLPVLSARDDRLRAAQEAVFPEAFSKAVTISNEGGWAAGQAAAEFADLDVSSGALHGQTR